MISLKIFLLVVLYFIRASECAITSAMAIDCGSEFTKAAIVKPKVPMEILLNRESKRKTASLVSIRGMERQFGDDAFRLRARFPEKVYSFGLFDLLGKKIDHPSVELFQKRFPQYKLVPDPNRGTVLFQTDDGEHHSVEELVAMIISEIQTLASESADMPVTDAVITVPPYFNQAERRAVIDAAKIARVNTLQLINDNVATGINYGMYRRKEFNENPIVLMIYDMGSFKTTATIYEFRLVEDKYNIEKNPQMTILGYGYDRTLGGFEISLRLFEYLLNIFEEKYAPKCKKPIKENAKALSRLFNEAERVKKVLSANKDTFAQAEHLHEEIDFKLNVTREKLDELIGDIFERVFKPIEDALKMAELKLEDVKQVVLMGGSTRNPTVQEKIKKLFGGSELGKSLNTDEAAVMGAVYKAADLSKGFKVKPFFVKELTPYPIVVDFDRESSETKNVVEDSGKRIRRTLFAFKNTFPLKKVMTFSKHVHDFEFVVNYGDLSPLNAEQTQFFGPLNISRVDFYGVTDAVKANLVEGVTYKGAKAHFEMDESGILHLKSADASFEKVKPPEPDAGILKNLGDKLSNLFSSGDKKDKSEAKEESAESKEKSPEETSEPEKLKNSNETKNDESKSEGSQNTTETTTNTTTTPEKPKTVIEKIPLKVEISYMDVPLMTKQQLENSIEKLKKYEAYEADKRSKEKARNDVESFILDIKTKFEEVSFAKFASAEEKEKILLKSAEFSDWLDEQGPDTAKEEYDSKLKELKDLTKDLFFRIQQAKLKPDLLAKLQDVLNTSSMFLTGMKNFTTGDDAIFTTVEIIALEKKITETNTWLAEKLAEEKKLPVHKNPTLTSSDIDSKLSILQREVQYLLTKITLRTPKLKKPEKTGETNETKINETIIEPNKTEPDDQAEVPETKTEPEDQEKHVEL